MPGIEIIEIKLIRNCLDGTVIKEVLLNNNINKQFINFFSQYGETIYMPSLTYPFFKVTIAGSFIIKGIENTEIIRIIFEDNVNNSQDYFIKLINEFNTQKKLK